MMSLPCQSKGKVSGMAKPTSPQEGQLGLMYRGLPRVRAPLPARLSSWCRGGAGFSVEPWPARSIDAGGLVVFAGVHRFVLRLVVASVGESFLVPEATCGVGEQSLVLAEELLAELSDLDIDRPRSELDRLLALLRPRVDTIDGREALEGSFEACGCGGW